MKTCSRCDLRKPLADFNRRAASPDGLHPYCRQCSSEVKRAWYEKNAEHARAEALRWARENPDQHRESCRRGSRAYRARHPERVAAGCADWETRNREARYAINARRRALKRAAFVEDVVPLVVLERDDGVCGICGGDVDPFDFHVDHIVPLSRGGEHSYANVQAAHPACNIRKRDSLLEAA